MQRRIIYPCQLRKDGWGVILEYDYGTERIRGKSLVEKLLRR